MLKREKKQLVRETHAVDYFAFMTFHPPSLRAATAAGSRREKSFASTFFGAQQALDTRHPVSAATQGHAVADLAAARLGRTIDQR